MRKPRYFPRFFSFLMMLAIAWAPLGFAQTWQGLGRAQGVVRDADGHALEGAKVTLRLDAAPQEGPPSTVTDAKGRWALMGLAGGRWRLSIEREGFDNVSGWLNLAAEGPSPLSQVEMQPLTQGLPRGLESGPRVIYDWLNKGNTLLEQGWTADARAEYLKAVRVLEGPELSPIWSAIARSYFLEKNYDQAAKALKRAVLAAPEQSETRRLLTEFAAGRGQGAEIEAWLARLDRDGAEVLAEELGPVFAPRPEVQAYLAEIERRLAAPPEPPRADRVGSYKTSFTERSPLSAIETFSARYAIPLEVIAQGDKTGGRYDLARESFEVVVPATYRRDRPAGLLVWVAPDEFGGEDRPEMLAALAELNLIWVGANHSGNPRPKWTRVGLALDAAFNLAKLYAIDPERVYIGGYSGGGRLSSAAAMVFPEVFKGAFCYMAVDFFRNVPRPDKPGTSWPQAFPAPERELAKTLKRDGAWVLVTGEKDYNRTQTRRYYREYLAEGFENVTLIDMPGVSHYDGVTDTVLRQGIAALDGRHRAKG